MSIESCNLCGRCNSACAVFRMNRKECLSNRHKAFLALKKIKNQDVFRVLIDGSAEHTCPAGIDVDEEVIRTRAYLIDHGVETEENKLMITNIRRYGSPYGKIKK